MASQSSRTGLLIIDHGSRREESNLSLKAIASALRAQGEYLDVVAAHMELGSPTVAEGLQLLVQQGAERVIVAPAMMGPGRHSKSDIPALAREGLPEDIEIDLRIAEPFGLCEGVLSAIRQRASEAGGAPYPRTERSSQMLQRDDCVLLVVDIQERLAPHIANIESVIPATRYLMHCAQKIGVPIALTEQYPQGLGRTDPRVLKTFEGDIAPIEKTAFGCFGESGLAESLPQGPTTLVVCGIEAHICVLQTVLGGIDHGWNVAVVEDAVGSRRALDRQTALERMEHYGALRVTAEMAVYEWLGRAGTDEFKELLPLLKAGPFAQ